MAENWIVLLAIELANKGDVVKLDFHDCEIDEFGATALAETLKTNNSVKEVWLYENQIGDGGAKAIAAMLKVNKSLLAVYLQSNSVFVLSTAVLSLANGIGNDGAKAVADALESNFTMQDLCIGLNRVTNYIHCRIEAYCNRNKQLKWKFVHAYLLDICVALAPVRLPPYVLLEIFDWLPTPKPVKCDEYETDLNKSCMQSVPHISKINLIVGVQQSTNKIRATYGNVTDIVHR